MLNTLIYELVRPINIVKILNQEKSRMTNWCSCIQWIATWIWF